MSRRTKVLAGLLTALVIFTGAWSLAPADTDHIVMISTKYGDIKIKLYNETPKHRDNFLKLAEEGYYNDLLFHRVIKQFMVQGGDPDSRNAQPGVMLGNGGPGYTIPAEFVPGLFHKRGVIAAAREADNINPQKESSGSQFYIVQGKVFTSQELDMLEMKINQNMKMQIMNDIIMKPENSGLRARVDSIQKLAQPDAKNNGMMKLIQELDPAADKELAKRGRFTFSKAQRDAYTTVGGTPHLDGNYTVFGEIIEGMNVVDSIAAAKTDANDRPLQDIKMTVKVLK